MKQPGLRERKKQETRDQIAKTARRLFMERGFDAVTVADVASEAEVSRKTVFNYFPTKEDLFYYRMEAFEARLLEAIRSRAPGESIVAPFARFLTDARGMLRADEPAAADQLAATARMIVESPALLAREQQIYAGYAAALAELIAEETDAGPDDVVPRVAADAMIGLHKALVDYVRGRLLAGERDRARVVRGLRRQAREAAGMLENGLGRLGT